MQMLAAGSHLNKLKRQGPGYPGRALTATATALIPETMATLYIE